MPQRVVEPRSVSSALPVAETYGVLFDGVSAAHGMRAGNQPQTLDSPVPIGAQLPLQDAPKVLNNLRSGMGAYFDQDSGPKDSLIKQGGVMSHD